MIPGLGTKIPQASWHRKKKKILSLSSCVYLNFHDKFTHDMVLLGSDAAAIYNYAAAAKSLQSCPTLCNPIDGSPPGFPVPGILQARTLEWVAISFSNL